MTTFVRTSEAVEQVLKSVLANPTRSQTVAALEAFARVVETGRGVLTTPTTATRLANEISKPGDTKAEREFYEAFCMIPAIIANQIPFLLRAEDMTPSRQAIFFLARELDFALDVAIARGETLISQLTTDQKERCHE
jgi:hypothetical protein